MTRPGVTGIRVIDHARSPFFWFGHRTGQVEENIVARSPVGRTCRKRTVETELALAGLNRLELSLSYRFIFEIRSL